jgi:LysM repeat protein
MFLKLIKKQPLVICTYISITLGLTGVWGKSALAQEQSRKDRRTTENFQLGKRSIPQTNVQKPQTQADVYIVQRGDNLYRIARRHGMTLASLLRKNKQFRSNPNLIYPGDKVYLGTRLSSRSSLSHRIAKESNTVPIPVKSKKTTNHKYPAHNINTKSYPAIDLSKIPNYQIPYQLNQFLFNLEYTQFIEKIKNDPKNQVILEGGREHILVPIKPE